MSSPAGAPVFSRLVCSERASLKVRRITDLPVLTSRILTPRRSLPQSLRKIQVGRKSLNRASSTLLLLTLPLQSPLAAESRAVFSFLFQVGMRILTPAVSTAVHRFRSQMSYEYGPFFWSFLPCIRNNCSVAYPKHYLPPDHAPGPHASSAALFFPE